MVGRLAATRLLAGNGPDIRLECPHSPILAVLTGTLVPCAGSSTPFAATSSLGSLYSWRLAERASPHRTTSSRPHRRSSRACGARFRAIEDYRDHRDPRTPRDRGPARGTREPRLRR